MGTTLQKTSNTTTKVTISGLSPSTTYIVEVAGVTSLGIGSYSLPLNATTDGMYVITCNRGQCLIHSFMQAVCQ